MKMHLTPVLALATGLLIAQASAGQQLSPAMGKSKIVAPEEGGLPMGNFTLGTKFSESLASGYLDSITPFWAPGDALFFLNTRTTVDSDSQSIGSYGLGFRYLVPGRDVIFGTNVFYDALSSRRGHDYDQLGVGVEILTRWFDLRANWYLPEDEIYVVDRFDRKSKTRNFGPVVANGNQLQQRVQAINRRTTFKSYEGALEGYNIEAGFLVPGVDKYFELRAFAGYYNLEGPFGRNFEGFKGRLEARFLPGIIADVEYYDDANVMGGHWMGGVRVTMPFSIFNIAQGRNPFEGFGESFRPRQREFRERMTDMIIRSHRIQTTESDARPVETRTTEKNTDVPLGELPPTPPRNTPPPPPPDDE